MKPKSIPLLPYRLENTIKVIKIYITLKTEISEVESRLDIRSLVYSFDNNDFFLRKLEEPLFYKQTGRRLK